MSHYPVQPFERIRYVDNTGRMAFAPAKYMQDTHWEPPSPPPKGSFHRHRARWGYEVFDGQPTFYTMYTENLPKKYQEHIRKERKVFEEGPHGYWPELP